MRLSGRHRPTLGVRSCQIEVTLKKGRKAIASEVVSDPKPGDLTIVVGKVFAQALKVLDGPAWDCQINIRRSARDHRLDKQ